MIAPDDDYKVTARHEGQTVETLTNTKFESGKRSGVMSFEDDIMIFREFIKVSRKRSKQIARTQHFSVLERPDGSIAGTFRFNPNASKIKGKLSAEFWQALTTALNLKVVVEDE